MQNDRKAQVEMMEAEKLRQKKALAAKMAARLAYHASTGPMPAYIWPADLFKVKKAERCAASAVSGYIEPLADGGTTLLDAVV